MKNAKTILAGVVAFTSAATPVTTLAYNVDNISSNHSSNIENLNARGGVQTGYFDTTADVNFRKTNSWSGSVISILKKGTSVYVSSVYNGWAQIYYNNTVGFIPSNYIQAVSKTEVTTSSVNLRSTASWSGNIIQVIKPGETVHTEGTSGEFSKVLYNGKVGYIPTAYIKSSTSTNNTNTNTGSSNTSRVDIEVINRTGKVVNLATGDTLNVRSGTSSSTSLLGKLSAGSTVTITGKDKITGWYRINYNGQVGYVSSYYIELQPETIKVDIETMNRTGKVVKLTTGDTLSVRSGTNSNTTLLGKLSAGSTVTITGKDKITGWYRINYNGQVGYVSSYYIELQTTTTTTYKKTTDNLNFRTGPSTSYSIISTIPKNTTVEVISTSNGWSKIKYNNKEGYVSATYLTDSNSSTGSTGGVSLPSSKPAYSNRTIAIDPGHGGHDPGAVGFGRYEKDIALSISKKINANLKTLGFKTVMTRSTDVYIPLSQRYTIANNNNANLFVSVHLNSGASSASGIETLYKNSKNFANDIQTEMIKATGARDRGLKYRSDLAVLNGTKMSASLVEVGFISNSAESSTLATNSYQDKLAASITKGIAKYTDSTL